MRARLTAMMLLGLFALAPVAPANQAPPLQQGDATVSQPQLRDALLRLVHVAHDPLRPDELASLKPLLRPHWPGVPEVGREGVDAAGELVRRASSDDAFQSDVEEAMLRRIGLDIDARAFAMLNDRIEVAHHRPPQFGVLLALDHGRVVSSPAVAAADVDALRDRIGLPPLAAQLAAVQRAVHAGASLARAWPTPRLSTPYHPVSDPKLATELAAMATVDQQAREAAIRAGLKPGSAELKRVSEVDAANLVRLRAILARGGFPDRSRVGRSGVEDAWLLVQHATADPQFMAHALVLSRPLMEHGQLSRPSFALLVDRVRLQQGRKQLYGSQLSGPPGHLVVMPLEDPAHVDARRATMGLGPLARYIAQTNAYYATRPAVPPGSSSSAPKPTP